MTRTFVAVALLIVFGGALIGCDANTGGALADVNKMLAAAKLGGNGDMTMDQIQQQDRLQLKDGTGANCPRARGLGTQDQDRVQQRLRDGSCQIP